MTSTLDELAIAYHTDKSSLFHGYTRWYERYFRRFVGTPVTILEIGITHCGSLQMWRQYFGERATVVGLDYSVEYVQQAERLGFPVYYGRQEDPELLIKAMTETKPDIVIDDGGHNGAHQIISFEHTFPRLNEGGIYVIEDLHAAYWGWGGHVLMPYLYKLVDGATDRGVSSYGDIALDPEDPANTKLSEIERHISGMHFHPSIVFIDKLRKGKS